MLLMLQVEGYEEILIETINLCCYYFENNMYMVPKEKYMLLKVECVCVCGVPMSMYVWYRIRYLSRG